MPQRFTFVAQVTGLGRLEVEAFYTAPSSEWPREVEIGDVRAPQLGDKAFIDASQIAVKVGPRGTWVSLEDHLAELALDQRAWAA